MPSRRPAPTIPFGAPNPIPSPPPPRIPQRPTPPQITQPSSRAPPAAASLSSIPPTQLQHRRPTPLRRRRRRSCREPRPSSCPARRTASTWWWSTATPRRIRPRPLLRSPPPLCALSCLYFPSNRQIHVSIRRSHAITPSPTDPTDHSPPTPSESLDPNVRRGQTSCGSAGHTNAPGTLGTDSTPHALGPAARSGALPLQQRRRRRGPFGHTAPTHECSRLQ
jgi:hypothetical protein